MRNTTILEKLLPSVINGIIVLGLSYPFLQNIHLWKIGIILLFFLYNVFFLVFNNNVCLGMMIVGTRWKKRDPIKQEFLYIILYTLSFSTLFIWIWFPFDIFLLNIFLLQLPTILVTGTTFHGYLSGNKASVIKKRR